MNDRDMVETPFPVLSDDGCLACGDDRCQPWPSLATRPEHTLRFAEPILMGLAEGRFGRDAGSRYCATAPAFSIRRN